MRVHLYKFSGQDTWSTSAVATSEDVEILRISFADFRSIVSPARLKDLSVLPRHFEFLSWVICWSDFVPQVLVHDVLPVGLCT